jgi:lactoylglutathione lyase
VAKTAQSGKIQIMKPNHLNLAVPNVFETRQFFEKYFGFRDVDGVKASNVIAVMTDDSGFILTLSNFNKATRVDYPEGFHVGFVQQSPERVNEINKILKDDGFDVEAPRYFHGSWTFYFRAPGGFTIEILSAPEPK